MVLIMWTDVRTKDFRVSYKTGMSWDDIVEVHVYEYATDKTYVSTNPGHIAQVMAVVEIWRENARKAMLKK